MRKFRVRLWARQANWLPVFFQNFVVVYANDANEATQRARQIVARRGESIDDTRPVIVEETYD